MSERVINGHIALLKNPYYWDAKQVRLTEVVYHPISDFSAAQDQFLAGNLDFTNRLNTPRSSGCGRTWEARWCTRPTSARPCLPST